MWRQFLTPLDYLRISLAGKASFDLWVPLCIAIAVGVAAYLANADVNILGNTGLLALSSGLLAALVGFFIAALAAVATFPNRLVDKPLDGHAATIFDRYDRETVVLSRRRFLCYLFGYLSFVSLTIFMVNVTILVLRVPILKLLASHSANKPPIEAAFVFAYVFLFLHLICVCLLGLHFLIYRLHRPHVDNVRLED